MQQPKRVLDLFCGAGGAAMGLHQAFPDAEIVGVDIEPQSRYPFEFVRADVCQIMGSRQGAFSIREHEDRGAYIVGVHADFVWASPPCQHYSDLAKRNGNGHEHPDLIASVRDKLRISGIPYVIENVDNAPLLQPQMLCGTMFDLRVFRHRMFETSFAWRPPEHQKHNGSTGTHRWPYKREGGYVQVTGGGNCTVVEARDAMAIDWMTKAELNEAVPPAYSRYIAEQYLRST